MQLRIAFRLLMSHIRCTLFQGRKKYLLCTSVLFLCLFSGDGCHEAHAWTPKHRESHPSSWTEEGRGREAKVRPRAGRKCGKIRSCRQREERRGHRGSKSRERLSKSDCLNDIFEHILSKFLVVQKKIGKKREATVAMNSLTLSVFSKCLSRSCCAICQMSVVFMWEILVVEIKIECHIMWGEKIYSDYRWLLNTTQGKTGVASKIASPWQQLKTAQTQYL